MKLSSILLLCAISSACFLASNKVHAQVQTPSGSGDGDDSAGMWNDQDLKGSVPPPSASTPTVVTPVSAASAPSASAASAPSASAASAPSPSAASAPSPSAAPAMCVPGAECYVDQDCGTDNPSSFCAGGALVGTCKCAACLTGEPCKDDADCGGLMHACQTGTSGLCNCRAAFKANGFPTFIDALTNFCNHRRCDGKTTDKCLGLPCRSGVCVCP